MARILMKHLATLAKKARVKYPILILSAALLFSPSTFASETARCFEIAWGHRDNGGLGLPPLVTMIREGVTQFSPKYDDRADSRVVHLAAHGSNPWGRRTGSRELVAAMGFNSGPYLEIADE
jgi:hypothetical protein